MRRKILLAVGITMGTSPLEYPSLLAASSHSETAVTANDGWDRAKSGSKEQLAQRIVAALEADSPESLAWQEVKALRHDLELARAYIAEERDFFRRREGQLLTARQQSEKRTQQLEGRLAEVNNLIEALERQLHETCAELQQQRLAAGVRETHLKQQLASGREDFNTLHHQHQLAELKLKDADEQLYERTKQLTSLEIQLATLESARNNLQTDLQIAQEALSQQRAEAEQLKQRLWIAQESLSSSKQEYTDLQQAYANLEQFKDRISEDLGSLSELALHYLSMAADLSVPQQTKLQRPCEAVRSLCASIQKQHQELHQQYAALLGAGSDYDPERLRGLFEQILSATSEQSEQLAFIRTELESNAFQPQSQLTANRVFLSGLVTDLDKQLNFQDVLLAHSDAQVSGLEVVEQELTQRLQELTHTRERLTALAEQIPPASVAPSDGKAVSAPVAAAHGVRILENLSLPKYMQEDLKISIKKFEKDLSQLELDAYGTLESGSARREHLLELAKHSVSDLISKLRTQGRALIHDRFKLVHLQTAAESQLADSEKQVLALQAELEKDAARAVATTQQEFMAPLAQMLAQTQYQLDRHCQGLNLCLKHLSEQKAAQAGLLEHQSARKAALASELNQLFREQFLIRAAANSEQLQQEKQLLAHDLQMHLDALASRELQIAELEQQLQSTEQLYSGLTTDFQRAQAELALVQEQSQVLQVAAAVAEEKQTELAQLVSELRSYANQMEHELSSVVELAGTESAARLHASSTLKQLASSYIFLAQQLEESYSQRLLEPNTYMEVANTHHQAALALEQQLLNEFSAENPALEQVLLNYREKFRSLLATSLEQQQHLAAQALWTERQQRASQVMLEQMAAELERHVQSDEQSPAQAATIASLEAELAALRADLLALAPTNLDAGADSSMELTSELRKAVDREKRKLSLQLALLGEDVIGEFRDSAQYDQIKERVHAFIDTIGQQGQQILELRGNALQLKEEYGRRIAAHQGIEAVLTSALEQADGADALEAAMSKLAATEALVQENVQLRQQALQHIAQLEADVASLERLNRGAPLVWQAVVDDLQQHYQTEIAALSNELTVVKCRGDVQGVMSEHKEGALLQGWIAGSQDAVAQRVRSAEAWAALNERQLKAQQAMQASLESHLQQAEEEQQLLVQKYQERDQQAEQAREHNIFLQQHLELAEAMASDAYLELSAERVAQLEQLEDLHSAVEATNSELKQANERLAANELEIRALQSQLKLAQSQSKQLMEELAINYRRIADTESAGLAEISNLTEQLGQREHQLTLSRSDIEQLQEDLATMLSTLSKQKELASASVARAQLYEEQMLQERAQRRALSDELLAYTTASCTQETQLTELQLERDQLREDLTAMQMRLNDGMKQIAALDSDGRNKQRMDEAYRQQHTELVYQLADLQEEINMHKSKYQILEQQYDSVVADARRLNEENNEAQQAVLAANNEYQQLASDLRLQNATLLEERDRLSESLKERQAHIARVETEIAAAQFALEQSNTQVQALRERLNDEHSTHQYALEAVLAERDTIKQQLDAQVARLNESIQLAEHYQRESVAKAELAERLSAAHGLEVSTLKRTIDAHQAIVSQMAVELDDGAYVVQDRQIILSRLEKAQEAQTQADAQMRKLQLVVTQLEDALRMEKIHNAELAEQLAQARSE